MRFLHDEAAGICHHIELYKLVVSKCDFEGKFPPEIVGVEEIMALFERSKKLFGLALPYYFVASRSAESRAVVLSDAVNEVEISEGNPNFLIVAYQDGGVVSISKHQLPFQVGAETAEWWRPYHSASRAED